MKKRIITLVVILAILGIAVAVIAPSYCDYSLRAKVAEGMVWVGDLKATVFEAFITDGMGGVADYSEMTSAYFSALAADKFFHITLQPTTGTIILVFDGLSELGDFNTVAYVPSIDGVPIADVPIEKNMGRFLWACNTALTTIDPQFLPMSCR